MANTSHNKERHERGAQGSSTFMLLAVLTAVALLAAAAALYLENAKQQAEPHAELALLSQSLARHAALAVAGDAEAWSRLKTALARLDELRSGVPDNALPGGSAAWTRISGNASVLLEGRAAADTLRTAAAWVSQNLP